MERTNQSPRQPPSPQQGPCVSILKGCLCLLHWLTHLRHQNCNLQLYRQTLAAQSRKVCLMLSFPVSLHARLPPLSKTLCPSAQVGNWWHPTLVRQEDQSTASPDAVLLNIGEITNDRHLPLLQGLSVFIILSQRFLGFRSTHPKYTSQALLCFLPCPSFSLNSPRLSLKPTAANAPRPLKFLYLALSTPQPPGIPWVSKARRGGEAPWQPHTELAPPSCSFPPMRAQG